MNINKDFMKIMRAGKDIMSRQAMIDGLKKQNNAGIVVGLCMFIACIVIMLGLLVK